MSDADNGRTRGPRDPVMRAFEVLLWMVDAHGSAWGLLEIAKGVEMHPSTLHRVIAHLERLGFVRQDGQTGRYSIGLEFLRLAIKVAAHDTIRQVALPCMREIVSATGEGMLLAVYDPLRKEMMLIGSLDSPQPIRQMRTLGEWLPCTAGSAGLSMLAFLPEDECEEILARPLRRWTERTIIELDELRARLAVIRRQGYAFSQGQRTPGAVGIAAPLWGAEGRVIGAIAISQPEQRFKPEFELPQAELVMRYADLISERLGAPTAILHERAAFRDALPPAPVTG
jgi:DNA-binding IclR family transcriptional regulator